VLGTSNHGLIIITGSDASPTPFFVSHAAAAGPADS